MKKQFWMRILLGMPLGVMIGVFISLGISTAAGTGDFLYTGPWLVTQTGSEVGAAAVQTLWLMVIGAVFGGASLIWKKENWSLGLRTAVFFVLGAGTQVLAGVCCGWIRLTMQDVVLDILTFSGIFSVIWALEYIWMRHRLAGINSCLKN